MQWGFAIEPPVSPEGSYATISQLDTIAAGEELLIRVVARRRCALPRPILFSPPEPFPPQAQRPAETKYVLHS